MRRRRVAFLAGVVLTTAVVGAAAGYAFVEGDADGPADEPTVFDEIDAIPVEMSGTVVVGWSTEAGAQEHEIELTSDDGALVARSGDRVAVGGGDGRWLRAAEDWLTLSASDPRQQVPGAGSKYELVVTGAQDVAGRSANVVDATVRGETHPAQRLALDDEFGFVLARTWFDEAGRDVRWVHFVEIVAGASDSGIDVPTGPADGAPDPQEEIGGPYTDPSTLPNGFELVGAYEHPDDLVQLHYSDGLASISVFEQPGRLDMAAMPPQFTQSSVDGHDVYEWIGSAGRMLVWEDDDLVYTLVGEAAQDDLRALADAVDEEPDSVVDRVTDLMLEPFGF